MATVGNSQANSIIALKWTVLTVSQNPSCANEVKVVCEATRGSKNHQQSQTPRDLTRQYFVYNFLHHSSTPKTFGAPALVSTYAGG